MVTPSSALERIIGVLTAPLSDEAVLELRATEVEEKRVTTLKEKLYTSGITASERRELEEFLLIEDLVGLAKAKAYTRSHAVAS